MNKNLEAWVTALRSGQYEQGQGGLRKGDKYCCLGVACELAVDAGVVRRVDGHGTGYTRYLAPGGSWPVTGTLPSEVRKWLGLPEEFEDTGWGAEGDFSLAELNDGGTRFPEIADIIERKWGGE